MKIFGAEKKRKIGGGGNEGARQTGPDEGAPLILIRRVVNAYAWVPLVGGSVVLPLKVAHVFVVLTDCCLGSACLSKIKTLYVAAGNENQTFVRLIKMGFYNHANCIVFFLFTGRLQKIMIRITLEFNLN